LWQQSTKCNKDQKGNKTSNPLSRRRKEDKECRAAKGDGRSTVTVIEKHRGKEKGGQAERMDRGYIS
jgi:hypothetical protein